ncbi:MAG: hypothetical protein J7641_18345 [Cyanobacteria bacterium SID2]|nr:hypothetical protein [Cyanobacteria bacterium SID2]MBP0005416.1 hypothetical protein [Cyanobacteria bacterium SBC]
MHRPVNRSEAAIERSRELEVIDRRIAISTEQQQLYEDRAEHHRDRRWTTWLVNPINAPFEFAANIFGGGKRQELDLAIENLELRASSIESQEFQLQVRRGEFEDRLWEEVLDLVLAIESIEYDADLLENVRQLSQLTGYDAELDRWTHRSGSTDVNRFGFENAVSNRFDGLGGSGRRWRWRGQKLDRVV